ncbi:MAG: DUF523 domain-containing protein [Patescibacteria group bacterium]
MKLCSACLLGMKCRYDGSDKINDKIVELAKKEKLIPVCPEVLGGLKIPHEPSEIQGDGRVLSRDGKNVSDNFEKGAEAVLRIAKKKGITEAIFKQKSPSCGCGKIYDGTFSGKIIPGDGITTALLRKNGIQVISEEEL